MKALVSRSRVLIWCATFLCALLVMVGCGVRSVANPADNTLDVTVQVFDHESADHSPSATTHIEIALRSPKVDLVSNIVGADAKTLVCDGNTALQVTDEVYAGDVPAQTTQYTCTYFWANGAQSAAIAIPVLLGSPPSIRDPASGATVRVPDSGDPGVTVSYDSSGTAGAQVVATASDYNKRSAASDTGPDRGSVTIPPDRFDAHFSLGWGTITLARSVSNVNISARPNNTAFHSVKLETFEQTAVTPVRWL